MHLLNPWNGGGSLHHLRQVLKDEPTGNVRIILENPLALMAGAPAHVHKQDLVCCRFLTAKNGGKSGPVGGLIPLEMHVVVEHGAFLRVGFQEREQIAFAPECVMQRQIERVRGVAIAGSLEEWGHFGHHRKN